MQNVRPKMSKFPANANIILVDPGTLVTASKMANQETVNLDHTYSNTTDSNISDVFQGPDLETPIT